MRIATTIPTTAGDVIVSDDVPSGRVQPASYAAHESIKAPEPQRNPLRGSVDGINGRHSEFSAADWSEMPASLTMRGNPLR